MKKDLELVNNYQKEMVLLGRSLALLSWDQETKMPKKGVKSRSETISFLSGLAHEKFTSDEFYDAVKRLKKEKLSEDNNIMINKLHKEIEKSRRLPKEFVLELSKTTSLALEAWKEARNKKDFKIFQPHLEKIVALKIKQAKYLNLSGHIYNSLLDSFEEGMTVEKLKPAFENLKKKLIILSKKIKSTKIYKKQNLKLLKGEFPKEIQLELSNNVVKRIGLNEENSRIDFSEHPFSTKIGLDDVRITTNIRSSPMFSFGSSMHEAGHSLYELRLPIEHAYDILGDAPSLGLHESQSRFWENMIGRSKPFWKYYFPIFKKKFKINGNLDEWYKEVNEVKPGLIRIEGDEVHYFFHIVLRFEIELGLIEGTIKVKDLPKVWNQKMKALLDVIPKDDKEGVLQDMHWSSGAFGYFPTYALGTIYASQLYNALKKQNPGIEKDIEKGDYSKIRAWLTKNIHKPGSKMLAEEIIKKACGENLNPEVYVSYLTKKYSEIYGFQI